MKRVRRANRKSVNFDENGDDDGDFSNGSGDEWTPDEKDAGSSSGDSQCTNVRDNDVSIENVPFDTTEGFGLKIVKNYKSSKHPVWLMYGYLMKEGKVVNRVAHKFFCKKCFDKKKFKG